MKKLFLIIALLAVTALPVLAGKQPTPFMNELNHNAQNAAAVVQTLELDPHNASTLTNGTLDMNLLSTSINPWAGQNLAEWGRIDDGDSITQRSDPKAWSTKTLLSYPYNKFGFFTNFAVGGTGLADVTNRYTTLVLPTIAAHPEIKHWLLPIRIGANDMADGNFTTKGNKWQLMYSNHLATIKAAGYWSAAWTIMPRGDALYTNLTVAATRDSWNYWIRSQNLSTFVIDTDTRAALCDCFNLYYFEDKIHPTSAHADVSADLFVTSTLRFGNRNCGMGSPYFANSVIWNALPGMETNTVRPLLGADLVTGVWAPNGLAIGSTTRQQVIDPFGRFIGPTNSPTIAAGASAGTSPTVAVSGSDTSHLLTITTGSSPAANGVVVTVTYSQPMAKTNAVVLFPANAASIGAPVCAVATTNGYTINVGTSALGAATTYQWNAK